MKRNNFKHLLATVALLLVGMSANAYDALIDGIYYYLDTDTKTASVTYASEDFNSYSGAVVIPSSVTYNNVAYDVTSIGGNAFFFSSGLTSITIPTSVTSIGEWAFVECSGLTSITIPSSVTTIWTNAFQNCSGLTSITIPSSVTSIGEGVFANCLNLTTIVVEEGNPAYDSREKCNAIIETKSNTLVSGCVNTTIPSTVKRIENWAFYGCPGLTSITIPEGVTSIGNVAFAGCPDLTSVIISNNVTEMGYSVFEDCHNLTSVTLPNGLTRIGSFSFGHCYKLVSVNIPESVTIIEEGAFNDCNSLTSATIPDGVTRIEGWAFNGCRSLESIIIPKNVTFIGERAFNGCQGLTTLTIPLNVKSIETSAFQDCSGLTSIILHGGEFGQWVFANCENLKDVYNYGDANGSLGITQENTFEEFHIGDATLHVPAELLASAKADSQWGKFGTIVGMGEAQEKEISIGTLGFATLFVPEKDVKIPEDVEACTGVISGNFVTLNLIKDNIPAGTPVILCGKAGTYKFEFTEGATPLGNNDLKGTAEPLTADGTQYVLAEKNGVVGFYQAQAGTTIPAGKAYIEVKGANVKGFAILDSTTGVESSKFNVQSEDAINDLSGRRVEKTTKGTYIVNGKKIMK